MDSEKTGRKQEREEWKKSGRRVEEEWKKSGRRVEEEWKKSGRRDKKLPPSPPFLINRISPLEPY
jgi:hypothetical protein